MWMTSFTFHKLMVAGCTLSTVALLIIILLIIMCWCWCHCHVMGGGSGGCCASGGVLIKNCNLKKLVAGMYLVHHCPTH